MTDEYGRPSPNLVSTDADGNFGLLRLLGVYVLRECHDLTDPFGDWILDILQYQQCDHYPASWLDMQNPTLHFATPEWS